MSFKVKLRTKNHSASELKKMLSELRTKNPIVVRLGSRTPIQEIFPRSSSRTIEINSIEGISNSRDKLLMKQCFTASDVRSAAWAQMAPKYEAWTTFPAIIKQEVHMEEKDCG